MGASQSARRLTINNEDGVIQISTDLVQRLTHNSNKTNELSNGNVEDGKSAETSLNYEHDQKQSSHEKSISMPSPTNILQSHQQYPEYTMTAYKMQQQKEMELQAQDQYWQNRLHNLKMAHEKINKIFQNEYKKAVDEISNSQGKQNMNSDSVVPPCCTDKAKVLECYQENPREILKCSSVVNEFNNCVDQRRANIIDARC